MLKQNVYFVIFPDVHLLDLSGPLEVFSTANELMEKEGHQSVYQIHTVSSRAGMIKSQSSVSLLSEALPPIGATIDTLVVVGGVGVGPARQDEVLIAWLKSQTPRVRRIVSICSGAFLLAECGILNGHRATTHWSVCEQFTQEYPQVSLEKNAIFVRDGSIWTSAGVTSGIDLALELISEDLGHKLAIDVARNLVVFLKRPGDQAQFSITLDFQGKTELFADLHAWMIDNLTSNLSVAVLAAFSCMSERSFARHYRKETGKTPAKAVKSLRLESAKNLLLHSDLPLKQIAECSGFRSEITFRRSFFEHFGSYPDEYRRFFS